MIHRHLRRAARATVVAAAAIVAAASCNVYDPSLLEAGKLPLGANAGSAGTFDAAGETSLGGDAGSAGMPSGGAGAGGSSGTAGAIENNSGAGGNAVSGSAGVSGGPAASGGDGNTAGAGAGSGAGGTSATTGGCAKLSVPLNESTDKAHFVLALSSPVDLSGATISMRLYVASGSGGTIFNYVQDSSSYHFFGMASAVRPLINSFSGWSTTTWNVGAQPDTTSTGIVKTNIKNIGIEINAQPSFSWSDPTVVYIDSITVTSPKLSITFDASSSVFSTPTTTAAPGQALWINSGSSDTTAAGTTVAWQANCQ